MTLEDNTEVVHSKAFVVDGKEMVKIHIEKSLEGCFQSAEYYLLDYKFLYRMKIK